MNIKDYLIQIYLELFDRPINKEYLNRCYIPIYEAIGEINDWIYLDFVDPQKKGLVLDELYKATFTKYEEEFEEKNVYYCYD